MGTLLGHLVPGVFFTLFAIWWGFCISIKHFYLHHRRKSPRKVDVYYSRTTFPCFCWPFTRRIPLESYLKLCCAILGMLGEFATGFTHLSNETSRRKTWAFGENNAQHITMFFGFAFASLLEILAHWKYQLPDGLDYLANILAYVIEAFLFHFHLHGRNPIDIHVHTLLVYAILFCVIATIWEYNKPNQILAAYARIAGTLLQGFWFFATGFILYFPSEDPYWSWSPSHEHILLITALFIWLVIFTCGFLFLQSSLIWRIYERRSSDNHLEITTNTVDTDTDNQMEEDGRNEQYYEETYN